MKNLLFFTLLLAALSSRAQSGDLSQAPGKITGLPVNGVFKEVTGPAMAVNAFNATFGKLLDASLASDVLAQPIGFDPMIFATISKFQPQLGQKRYTGTFNIFLFNYIRSNSGSPTKVDEAPAFIKMYLNPADFFTQTAGFFDAYDEKLKIPHPFQGVPVTDSTADYTEYSFKSYPFNSGYDGDFAFRVLSRNDKPIFVPFTRNDYVQYQIAKEQLHIKDNEEKVSDFKSQIIQSQKNLKEPVFKNSQQVIKDGIQSTEGTIRELQAQNAQYQERINHYQNLLSTVPTDEANAVAYVDMESTRYTHSDPPYLVPYGRKEGWPLYIVNPSYYDQTQPPTKTQAIVVTYWYHQQFCPDFLKERTKQIFERIDYHRLKESMR